MRRLLVPSGVAIALAAAGCSSDGSTPGSFSTERASLRAVLGGTGGTATRGVEATSEIIVEIDWVKAHGPGGWIDLRPAGDPLRIDILRLAEHAQDLGIANLSGSVNQIRLHVNATNAPFVTLADGVTQVPLKVPSGEQSGIKLKGKWDVGACERLTANLELDGKKSIWVHPTGHGDLWILRPVIRLGPSTSEPIDGCDPNNPPTDPTDPTNPGDPGDPTDPGDVDGDGTPDIEDGDIDGDGIPNDQDPTPNGGLPDPTNPGDLDGDGTPDADDPDVDGDGIPNAQDPTPNGEVPDPSTGPDSDGDGIPDASDPDVDGDGIPNGQDPTPNGEIPDPSGTGGTVDPVPGEPGGAGAPCESHDQCGLGLFCDVGNTCSNV